ncbi:probable F420-dependent oxidoreductase, MSMEG_2256 family [Geodermatophilus telluris]|uniref:Probable F420-dependent oxidoreductase, MSMEG_2256 family n=1 Tax=Geodermatophilus telluris TaxID=1190417 RepID=A0A1G6V114_9ACTN|nr:TIGR03617 family F420-dependent LLM class oxidoreductase [Geodermatophilus telluris]SDD47300.1 probable F420-dependent oxidoreductase, MSMEG_2256 family [Geodermatophilus telluris]
MQVDRGAALDGPVDVRADARAAEDGGYDGFWVSEVAHDPFVGLAVAALATERVRLGTAIAVAFARTPMTTAAAADDLQALSGGRLVLGLGTQVKAHVTRRFSMPWSHPAARMREYVLALRAIWDTWHTGAPLAFRGEFYTHTLMTPVFTPPPHGFGPPPVLLAGVGETMTEVAGEVADGFLPHGFTTERYLREVSLPALERGRARTGRTLEGFVVAGSPMVAAGRTEEELAAATAAVRAQLAFYGSTPAYRPVLELHGWGELGERLHALSLRGRWEEMGRLLDDEVLDALAVVGRPEEAGREVVRRYGDLVDRISLATPRGADPGTTARVVAAVREAAG